MRLAYADPPYPGRAHLYADHPDYDGEVDHRKLVDDLQEYDGWALSTSASALGSVLELVREHTLGYRVLAWVKHTITVGWEPVVVVPARRPDGLRDWIQCEPDAYQWRAKPGGYVIGQKPESFCLWLFAWLGGEPGDTLDDLFPGSGNVSRAWDRWQASPSLPVGRSAAAEGRAGRRAAARAMGSHPELLEGALVEAAAVDFPVHAVDDPGSHDPVVVRSAVSTSADEEAA